MSCWDNLRVDVTFLSFKSEKRRGSGFRLRAVPLSQLSSFGDRKDKQTTNKKLGAARKGVGKERFLAPSFQAVPRDCSKSTAGCRRRLVRIYREKKVNLGSESNGLRKAGTDNGFLFSIKIVWLSLKSLSPTANAGAHNGLLARAYPGFLIMKRVGVLLLHRGVARIFQRRGGRGSHWINQYRHGVFATEYCRLFA